MALSSEMHSLDGALFSEAFARWRFQAKHWLKRVEEKHSLDGALKMHLLDGSLKQNIR